MLKWKVYYQKASLKVNLLMNLWQCCHNLDAEFKARVEAAKAEGKVLRYVGQIKRWSLQGINHRCGSK